MEPETSAAPAREPDAEQPDAEQADIEQPEPRRKPLGPLALFLLWVAMWAALVSFPLAGIVLAFLLGGHPVLTTVLLLIGIVPGLWAASKVAAYRRRRSGVDEALAAVDRWALGRGLARTDDPATTLDVAAAPFDLAGRHTAVHTWTGRHQGQAVVVLHYLVDTGTSDYPERRMFTAVAATGHGDLPLTEATPQRGAAAIAARVGRDLDVESAEFNRAWRVSASDERATHALLTPLLIDRMLAESDEAVRTVWNGGVIVTVEPGAVLDTDVLARRIAFVADLAALVPGFARTDGGASGAPAAAGTRPEVTGRRRTRTRTNTELVLLLVAVAGLLGGSRLWTLAPVAGTTLVVLGLVIGLRSTLIAAWIDRRRGRE